MNTRNNILLIGRTGSGKSTLANVLINENKFNVSSGSVSETKNIEEGTFEVNLKRDGSEKIKYRVIDTIGLGDTNMTPQGVLMRLAEMASRVKREGLNQVLFVTKGRFTKEEIEAYDLLSAIIFDKDVIKYTTIVRTDFEDFEDEEICEEDREALKIENSDLAHIIRRVRVVYVDNPPLKGRSAATNKIIREESRKRLLTHLATCEGNYRPSNIDTLDERVHEYQTNEEKLHKKLEELETIRKEEREKFLQEMAELKKKQTEELKRMEEENKKNIHNVKVEGEENLRKTKSEMETQHKNDMSNLEQKNKETMNDLKNSYEQQSQTLKSSFEGQMKNLQDQNRRDREATEDLRKELREKNSSSSKAIEASVASLKADDSKHEERLLAETRVRMKELEIKEKEVKGEQERLNKLNDAEVAKKNQEKEAARKKADLEQEKASTGFLGHIKKKVFTGYDNG